MTPDILPSRRRRAPAPIRTSAGVSGFVHAGVLAIALFGYPVIDVIFATSPGKPYDVLEHGESEMPHAAAVVGALDPQVTDDGEETSGGVDPQHDVSTDSSGEVGYTVDGDTLDPMTRAGEPNARPTPPTAASAEPPRNGLPDGIPGGTSKKLATREIIVMVTLHPDLPERLDGTGQNPDLVVAEDGINDGDDLLSQPAAPVAGTETPHRVATSDTPALAFTPDSTHPGEGPKPLATHDPLSPGKTAETLFAEAAIGPEALPSEQSTPKTAVEEATPGLAPNGMQLDDGSTLAADAPHASSAPSPEASNAKSAAAFGSADSDDERDERLDAIVVAVTRTDDRFARAILEPQEVIEIGGLYDPTKRQRLQILQAAAAEGFARAQYALARQYIIGEEPQATMREAIELLRDAAERGDVDAQLLLGVIFAQGKLASRDLVESQLYFTLAAAQGSPEAETVRADIERDMSLKEIIVARKIGREYRELLHALNIPRAPGTRGERLRDELLDAAAAGNTAVIARTLARGTDIETTDAAGRTAVINAAWRGRMNAIELLLQTGADIDTTDNRGRSALAWAASNGHRDVVERLIEAGASLNVADDDGITAVMRAAWNGHRNVVDTLISAGADESAIATGPAPATAAYSARGADTADKQRPRGI